MAEEKEMPPEDRRLSPEANAALTSFTQKFEDQLRGLARKLAVAKKSDVTGEDVEAAYDQILNPRRRPRLAARRMIAGAFAENRKVEFLAYAMMIVLFLFGLAAFTYGVFSRTDETGRFAGVLGGSIMQVLLVMPLRLALNARRHNFAIRIFGFLLDRVDDPALLADLIRQLLLAVAPEQSIKAGNGQ
jgi:hypothetical protein